MKISILVLSFAGAFMSLCSQAQVQTNTAFAITGETKGNLNWTVLREVDLSNGSLVRNIYLPLSQSPVNIDASTGKVLNINSTSNQEELSDCNCALGLSAASAYDVKQNRLYFINLFGSELQYIDLNQRQLKIYHVENQPVKQFVSQPGEADNITRMAFGSDNYGYALTNSGDHLIRFSTGKDIRITDLGSLKDGQHNGAISVHTQTASWGGDIVADDGGNLYLFTIGGHVFKINPATMVADFLGTIKNLPAHYSINAAAVNKDGQIVVSSSLNADNYYSVNLSTLEANTIQQKVEKVFNASDFANGNFIATGGTHQAQPAPLAEDRTATNKTIGVYPNPVINKTVHIYFSSALQGKSMIELAELSGKKIANVEVSVTAKGQIKTIQLPASVTSGVYVVHIVNADKSVFSENVVVE